MSNFQKANELLRTVFIIAATFASVKILWIAINAHSAPTESKVYSTPPYQWDTVTYTIWSDSAIGTKLHIVYNEEFVRINDSIDIVGGYTELKSSNQWRFIGEGHKIDIFRGSGANWIHWWLPNKTKIIAKD